MICELVPWSRTAVAVCLGFMLLCSQKSSLHIVGDRVLGRVLCVGVPCVGSVGKALVSFFLV